MNSPINDVSDTAFWIAYHRALETAREDALFKDPWAAALAGERGRRISEEMPTSGIVAWTVALRTRIIDEYLASAIESGIDTVLSLGAGLGRPMPLPPVARGIMRISRLWMPAARREAFRTFGGYAMLEPSTGRRT